MDNYVFNIPIAAHHPYEQNISDYDEYFLRDLDAIFPQPVDVTAGTSQVLDFYQRPTNNDWDGSLSTPAPPDVGDSLQPVEQPWPVDFYFENKIDCQQSSLPENIERVHTEHAVDISIRYNLTNDQEEVAKSESPVTKDAETTAIGSPKNATAVATIPPTFQCNICTKPFATKRALTCHKARSSACFTPASNRCDACQLDFPIRRDLQAHIRVQHKSRSVAKLLQPNLPNFACPLCTQSFTTRNARNQHKRTHRAGDLVITNSSHHPQTASTAAKRSFKCDICPRSFNFRTLLNHHRATEHAPKRRYPCQIGFCDQVFETDALLKRHEQRRHVRVDVAAAPADDDDQSEKLAGHTSDSSSESFSDLAAVALVKSDTRVRCPNASCGLTFANVVQLRRHQTLHRLRTYRCAQCAREYHSRAVFETHTRLSHPLETAKAAALSAGGQPAADADDVVLVADEDHDSGPMDCADCGQLFENRRVLRQHRAFCVEENDDVDGDASRASAIGVAEEKGRAAVGGEPLAIEEVYVKQEPIDELPDFVMEE